MDTYFEYRVKGGDSLSAIIFNMFGFTTCDRRYKGAITYIMSLNPQIKNPNRIYTGDILLLGVIPQTQVKPQVIARVAPKSPNPTIQVSGTSAGFITSTVAPPRYR